MGIPLKKYCENKVSAEDLSNKRKMYLENHVSHGNL